MNLADDHVLAVALVNESGLAFICKRDIERFAAGRRATDTKRNTVGLIKVRMAARAWPIPVQVIQVQPRRSIVDRVNWLARSRFAQRGRVERQIVIEHVCLPANHIVSALQEFLVLHQPGVPGRSAAISRLNWPLAIRNGIHRI